MAEKSEKQDNSNAKEDLLNTSSQSDDLAQNQADSDGLASSGDSETLEKKRRMSGVTASDDAQSPTISPRPGSYMVAASPPKYVSFEEIMKAAAGVTNMKLAHEIALDPSFELKQHEPQQNSLEKQVQEIVHKAFWDILSEKLREDPPDYSHALILLSEVKSGLLELLLPQHKRFKQSIEEVLDLDLIEQKVEHDALDFHYYAGYVISIMARLCSPGRDPEIEKLQTMTEVVPLYRDIFRVLDLMKMDMANFTIQQLRPLIQQQSVGYERQKFDAFLKQQTESNVDGLQSTKSWLRRSAEKLASSSQANSSASASANLTPTPAAILNNAYLDILEWPEELPYPETLLLDQQRFTEIQQKLERLTLVCSLLLVTFSVVGSPIAGLHEFKEKLKKHLMVILADTPSSEIASTVPSIAEKINSEVQTCLTEHGFSVMDETRQMSLKDQLKQAASHDHVVHKLMRSRWRNFASELLSSERPNDIRLPAGMSTVSSELGSACGQYLRLSSHNRSVFGSHYTEIIANLLAASNPDMSPTIPESSNNF